MNKLKKNRKRKEMLSEKNLQDLLPQRLKLHKKESKLKP
tara:strand:+ start:2527 stop:2643 length:117 start_codon:yes stop_codon:yes gene_type:complete